MLIYDELIFGIEYIVYLYFRKTRFRYNSEDYGVLFSALADTYSIQYTAKFCDTNMSKNIKNDSFLYDQIKLPSMTGNHQGSIFLRF